MGLEQRRMQLMSRRVEWGDSPSPPHLSKQVEWGSSPSQSGSLREQSLDFDLDRDDGDSESTVVLDDAPIPDDLIMADPKTRKKPHVKPAPMFSSREWTLESLVNQSKNFHPVPRVRWSPGRDTIKSQIREHEDANQGVPLVVEGLHKHPGWKQDKFTPEWLQHNVPGDISVRNVYDRTDKNIPLSDFIARTRETSPFAATGEKERLYGKDVECPPEWKTFLHSGIFPPYLAPDAPENLLNTLPKQDRPETLMCYLGVGDTFTPCHKDLCASSGHNLMCYTENGGSSFWFMTATSSANDVTEYFHHVLKQELDHEAHVITLEELAKAPFQVYITEQKLGDLVLVPPRSAHQVVNAGGITIKTSWSRMTLDGLSLALRYELPLYRRVCRAEVYRVKATIYHTLLRMMQQVSELLCNQPQHAGSRNAMASTSQKDTRTQVDKLLRAILLFDSILIEEYSPNADNMRHLASDDTDEVEQVACDFCGGDIFLSFFECRSCVDGSKRADPGAGFIVCPGCYVEGRTCHCEVMVPMQCRLLKKLFQDRARAVELFRACSELIQSKDGRILSNQQLKDDDRLGLFRAALLLRSKRVDMKKARTYDQPRRCTVRRHKELNHDNPISWVLPCKKCHSAICFAHNLWDYRLHSTEALIADAKDPTTSHETHQASQKRFKSEIVTLKREALDYVPDFRVQLVYLATTFSTCRPINPNPNLWKAGWYDLQWEIILPEPPAAMSIKVRTTTNSQPTSRRPTHLVMDHVLITTVPRPAKRKDRAVKQVSPVERSGPRINVESDDDGDDGSSRKRLKRTHPPRGPPGSPVVIRPNVERPTARRIGGRNTKNAIVIDSSDSEEEMPLKRSHISSRVPKPNADLRFQAKGQTAASLADALNNASVQNSKSIPTPVHHPPSSPPTSVPNSRPIVCPSVRLPPSSAATTLPRKKVRRKAAPAITTGPAPSTSTPQGSNSNPALPGIEGQLAMIRETLSAVQADQARQAAELEHMRRTSAPEKVADFAPSSSSTESTIKVVADLVSGLVSAFQQPNPPTNGTGVNSRNWSNHPYRGRSRGRGGALYGDHRSMAPNYIPPEGYRPARQHHHHHGGPFPGPTRHAADRPGTGQYYEQRVWLPGPHAQERREEREVRYQMYTEERRVPPEGTRRRNFTRFSAPSSPGNGLDVVLSRRHSQPLSARISHFEGEETGSDASGGTLTNVDGPSGNVQLFRRQTPAMSSARDEEPSARKDKFFRTLGRRSRSPTPDEQDWEAQYEKDA